ncbi:MAG: Hint domain-containing protein [Gemmobacter sp.]|nr:Hint domain-containing protein [Gemmobacter sp.]
MKRIGDQTDRVRGQGGPTLGHPHTAVETDGLFFSEGILAGTLVATQIGWRRAETLSPGDMIQTFDCGLCRLSEVHHAAASIAPTQWPSAHWPLAVPAGVIGNASDMRILPGQLVLLDSDIADDMLGDPFALIPARALDGWRGIAPHPPGAAEQAVVLLFDEDQIVYAASSVLLFCPGLSGQSISTDASGLTALQHPKGDGQQANYVPLSLTDARDLVACMMAQDLGAALAAP